MFDKIVCIDDDVITLMLCKKVIERVEFAKEIITFKNGEEALHYFDSLANSNSETHPKLVLLDLNMPIINGWELLDIYLEKEYQKHFNQTKFIILSSTIDPQDVNKSKEYEMVIDFISKPITKEILGLLKLNLQDTIL